MKQVPQFLIGADPEVFARNPNSGLFVSAAGLIPGTKHDPHVVHKGAIQVDGMALEFNIDPAGSRFEFTENVKIVFNTLRGMVPGYELMMQPSVTFDKDVYDAAPEDAKELGCDPDFNGWTGDMNPRPDGRATTLRTAAGHIHVGWTMGADVASGEHFKLCMRAARQLDFYLGAPSILWDKDTQRRSLYGKAGAFRPKHYGFEYRVLSNAWLRNEALTGWVYDAAVKGMQDLWDGDDQPDLEEAEISDRVKACINEGVDDKELLHDILSEYVPEYPEV